MIKVLDKATLMSWKPCWFEADIDAAWDWKTGGVTASELGAATGVSVGDRLWCLLRMMGPALAAGHAKESAARARVYANAAAADYAAHADHAAARAAEAAAHAAARAADYAAHAAEAAAHAANAAAADHAAHADHAAARAAHAAERETAVARAVAIIEGTA